MPRHRSGRVKESDEAYRNAHRAEAAARTRAWAKANPEKRRETERRYKAANRVKITEQKRAWRKANPEKHREANKRWKINRRLKLCDYDAILAQQDGICAICGMSGSGRRASGRLAIDHSHATGVVRGLLCHRCNAMLGLAKDSTRTLTRAVAYLEAADERSQGGGAVRDEERTLLGTP